jgi:hypothetical protein
MAKPIKLGLTLRGQNAINFHNYMKNPDSFETPEGRKLISEASKLNKKINI